VRERQAVKAAPSCQTLDETPTVVASSSELPAADRLARLALDGTLS